MKRIVIVGENFSGTVMGVYQQSDFGKQIKGLWDVFQNEQKELNGSFADTLKPAGYQPMGDSDFIPWLIFNFPKEFFADDKKDTEVVTV